MDISSIVLTSLFASYPMEVVSIDLVANVVGVDADSPMAIGEVGANDDANVEGTIVVTVGTIVVGELSILHCLRCINLSSSFSISFN